MTTFSIWKIGPQISLAPLHGWVNNRISLIKMNIERQILEAWRSLATTESGHLRPQTKKQDLGHLWPQSAVTYDHKTSHSLTGPTKPPQCTRSLVTTLRGHLRPKIGITWPRITCTHARGGWGGWGGWDDNVPCTCTHTSRTHHLFPCTGWVGWVGWDDNVPCTCTHTSRTHHLYPCARWVGWLGWVGWVGWYRSETRPTFPNISKNPTGQQFQG